MFALLVLALTASARNLPHAATYAGSTATFSWPPEPDTASLEALFPDANQVGYPGPTPTGDEADAIQTAPAYPVIQNAFPLVVPTTADHVPAADFDTLKYWGNLSPMYSVAQDAYGLPDASPLVPAGCEITDVHLLMRHGARYPTSGSGPAEFAATINEAATNGSDFYASGPLKFLNTWTYKLGAEILTPFGRQQLFDHGAQFRVRYGDLLKRFTHLPVWRTTSEDRMVDSALNFAAGFFDVRNYQTSYLQTIIIESSGFNNTLAPYDTCANSNNDLGYIGDTVAQDWANIYLADAVERINGYLRGIKLGINDVNNMQALCAYETVALGYSAFCDLFTEEEWKGYEYYIDLDFYYNDGPGNPTAAAQGLGWLQEFIARLTATPITEWDSTTNSTLDDNDVTFPLDQSIYVDASHDTVIANILAAFNFPVFTENGPLPFTYIPEKQTYIASQISPFASRFVTQLLSCPSTSSQSSSHNPSSPSYQNTPASNLTTPTHIRFILNDAVFPLVGFNGANCPYSSEGLCELEEVVEALKRRADDIDYAYDCSADYSVTVGVVGPGGVIDGTPWKQ